MRPNDSIPVLEYPRDLYVHAFAYWSWRGFRVFAVLMIMTLACMWAGVRVPGPAFSLEVGALLCGIATIAIGFRILNDSKDVVRFTTVGVEARGKFVPWSHVTRVAARGYSSSQVVQLFYTVRLAPGLTINHPVLPAGEGITVAEYEQLVGRLKKELSASYPKLELGGYFQVEIY